MPIPHFMNPMGRKKQQGGGSGTIDDPYLIYTSQQLYDMRNEPAAYYKQMADIDLSEGYPGAPNWTSIRLFKGGLDGNGFKIINFRQTTSSSSDYHGLLGDVQQNINLKNIYILDAVINTSIGSSGHSVGILIGEYYGTPLGIIENCHVSGSIVFSGSGFRLGGIAGALTGSSSSHIIIRNCSSDVIITHTGSSLSSGYRGGFIGYAQNLEISDSWSKCQFTSSVSGTKSANMGGFIGMSPSFNKIERCYSEGTITLGGEEVGGFLGRAYSSAICTNCYSKVSLIAGAGVTSGFCGDLSSSADISNCLSLSTIESTSSASRAFAVGSYRRINCYYDSDIVGINAPSETGATPLTTAELKAALPPGFDPTIWAIDPATNEGYPHLINNPPV